jgi:hypothetical protein
MNPIGFDSIRLFFLEPRKNKYLPMLASPIKLALIEKSGGIEN